ncbi:DID protein [Danaus plexippus plexippus]|uniref:Elongator complex protein 6 n=1 Tax=Danaus plexippus plexippus TaxID=278856 RepID=A0A212EZY7_DANPL|nr:DID protein [Danaus plexippus plexippus]
MNYNLQKSVDSKIINFYDLGNELVSNMFEDKDSSLEFMCKIKEQIKAMYDKNGTVNVIFDGVSHLFDLELTLKDINSLCKDVIDLLHSYNNSFLIFHCNVSHCDNVTNVLANLLSHKSHILVEVESLPSGLSSDVSGRLTIRYLYRKFQSVNLHIFDQKSSQYLFKLFDRGVKLLAPGTV